MRLRARRACHVTIGALDLEVDVRARRGAADRDLGQVHARRVEADYAACGLELAEWFTDDDGLFALSLASIASARRRTPSAIARSESAA